jgi:hypothetical protein
VVRAGRRFTSACDPTAPEDGVGARAPVSRASDPGTAADGATAPDDAPEPEEGGTESIGAGANFYGLSIGLEVLLLVFILHSAWTWPRTSSASTPEPAAPRSRRPRAVLYG